MPTHPARTLFDHVQHVGMGRRKAAAIVTAGPADGPPEESAPTGRRVLASTPILIPLLIIGWFALRERIATAAAEREGHTGAFPVVAERPAIDHPPSSGTRDDE